MAANQNAALVLGNYRPTLQVASTLNEMNFKVIITRDCGGGYAHCSKFVDETWDHPPLEEPENFYHALGKFLHSRPEIRLVYPVWETCLRDLPKYQNLLPENILIAGVEPDTVETCIEKPKMQNVVEGTGFPIARYLLVNNWKALLTAIDAIGFPLIVRPVNSRTTLIGKKALIAETKNRLFALLSAWPREHGELIVQRYVRGPRINLFFAAQQGNPIRYLATQILQTDVRDGTGFAVEGRTIDLEQKLKTNADRLLAKMNYHGVGLMQFIQDEETGEHFFLELNPRVAGSHAVPEACGMELGRLTVDLARERLEPDQLRIGPSGKHYAWTYGALSGIYRSLKSGEIGYGEASKALLFTLITAIRADIHLTWRWNDPLPTLAAFAKHVPGMSRGTNLASVDSGKALSGVVTK